MLRALPGAAETMEAALGSERVGVSLAESGAWRRVAACSPFCWAAANAPVSKGSFGWTLHLIVLWLQRLKSVSSHASPQQLLCANRPLKPSRRAADTIRSKSSLGTCPEDFQDKLAASIKRNTVC